MIEILGAGKLILDVLKEIRALLGTWKSRRLEVGHLGTLLELYGSAMCLSHAAMLVEELLDSGKASIEREDQQIIWGFQEELRHFLTNLNKMNFCVIDIFYPHFRQELMRLVRTEFCTLASIEPHFHLEDKSILERNRCLVKMVVEDYNALSLALREPWLEDIPKTENARDAIRTFLNSLTQCRSLLGQIVRENWDLRDFFENEY